MECPKEEKKFEIYTLAELYDKMSKRYDRKYKKRPGTPRNLIITLIEDNYGDIATTFFSLNGSPPRGYAIYRGNIVSFYDRDGERYCTLHIIITTKGIPEIAELIEKNKINKYYHYVFDGKKLIEEKLHQLTKI